MTHLGGDTGHPLDSNGNAFTHDEILAAAGDNFDQGTAEVNAAAQAIDQALNADPPDPPDLPDFSEIRHVATLDVGPYKGVNVGTDQYGNWFFNNNQVDPGVFAPAITEAIAQATAGGGGGGGLTAGQSLAHQEWLAEHSRDILESDRQYEYEVARDEELLRFSIAKEGYYAEQGNEERRLQAHGLIEQIQSRIESNNIRRQELMIETASRIGELAQNPADIGKLAGFLRAGLTVRDLIAGGQNAITDESLGPIQSLLQSQQDLVNAPQQQAPSIENLTTDLDFADFMARIQGGMPGGEVDAVEPEGEQVVAANPRIPGVVTDPFVEQLTYPPGYADGFHDPSVLPPAPGDHLPTEGFPNKRPPGFADGGTTNAKHVLVGEEGPELIIRNADGSMTVVPNDELGTAAEGGTFGPRLFDTGNTGTARPGVPRNEIGAPIGAPEFVQEFFRRLQPPAPVASSTAANPTPPKAGPVTQQDARDFIAQSGQDALRLGGFEKESDVSPLKVAAPGTPQFLRDTSASTSAALGYGPMSLFFEELMRLIPQGRRQALGRRTR